MTSLSGSSLFPECMGASVSVLGWPWPGGEAEAGRRGLWHSAQALPGWIRSLRCGHGHFCKGNVRSLREMGLSSWDTKQEAD